MKEVLTILKNDAPLKALLGVSKEDYKIYLNSTFQKDNSIVYKYVPLLNDSIKMQSRLEIDCISSDYEKCMKLLDRVQRLLLTKGDLTLTNKLITIVQNGGGYVFDETVKLHKFKAIFIITERMR